MKTMLNKYIDNTIGSVNVTAKDMDDIFWLFLLYCFLYLFYGVSFTHNGRALATSSFLFFAFFFFCAFL